MSALIPVKNKHMILGSSALGYQALKPAYGLSELAEILDKPEFDGSNATIVNAAETAIPDICAHIQYLRTNLAKNNLDFSDEAVKAWVGVMAIIALSEHRDHFQLSVENICINGTKTEYMKNIYCEALEREKMLDADRNLRVLSLKGNPIAILDQDEKVGTTPYRCFCYPFSTIDNPGEVMFAVKWFHAGGLDEVTHKRIAHRWDNVLGVDKSTGRPFLSKQEKAIFAEWLYQLKQKFTDYAGAVNCVIRALGTDIADANGDLITVQTTFSNQGSRPANLTAWRGVLACIALSNMRGAKIDIEIYRSRSDFDPYRTVMLCGEPSMMIVKVNGARVAYLDDNIFVRPFYYVTDPLTHIPWFHNGEWVEITDDSISFNEMDKSERCKLAWWYDEQTGKTTDPNTVKALNDSSKNLQKAFGAKLEGGKSTNVIALNTTTFPDGSAIPEKYTAIMSSIKSVPDYTNPMPSESEMFTDRLLMTMVGNHADRSQLGILKNGIDNIILLKDDRDPYNPKTERFVALLPLRSSFTKTFSEDIHGINLSSLNFTVKDDTITVHITLINDGAPVSRQWTYYISLGTVMFHSIFPYMSMWPYIRSDSWMKYYVTCAVNERQFSYSPSVIFGTKDDDPLPNLKPVETAELVTTKDNDASCQWKLITYNQFPEYIHFVIEDGGINVEVGSVYAAPPQKHKTDDICFAAIDFGTSNTIIRLTDSQGKIIVDGNGDPYPVFNNDYVKPLTMSANQLDDFYDAIKDFHRFYWLPYEGIGKWGESFWQPDPSKRSDKLPTVVQLYNGVSITNNEAPRFGKFLKSDCDVIKFFLAERDRRGKEVDQIGLYSNMKMIQNTDLFVAHVGLEMLLLYCGLAAIEKDAKLVFMVSYPDSRMWKTLNKYWQPAAAVAKNTCTSIIFSGQVSYRTTELWAAKYYATQFAGGAQAQAGYSILDIGGGTSDISFWKSENALGAANSERVMGALSLKYAGNQVVAESVFSFYRWLHGKDDDSQMENFKMLWDLRSSDTVQEYEKDMERGFERLCKEDFNVKHNVKKAQDSVPLLVNTIVGACPFSEAVKQGYPHVVAFKSLLKLKISNIFYVLSRMLDLLGAYDDINPRTVYQVCLAGNGASALDACGEEMIPYLTNMMKLIVADREFGILNHVRYRKTEVVNGMCKLLEEKILQGNGSLDSKQLHQPMIENEMEYDDIEKSELIDEMWKSYNQYVEGVLKPNCDFFAVDSMTTIYDMLTMFENGTSEVKADMEILFENNCVDILNQVLTESDSRTPLYVVAHIAAIKLIDRILLVHKYK